MLSLDKYFKSLPSNLELSNRSYVVRHAHAVELMHAKFMDDVVFNQEADKCGFQAHSFTLSGDLKVNA